MYYDAIATGKRIKNLRRGKGLTQEQLANRLDITDRYIRSIEAGKRNASLDLLVELSELFDVSLDYIILGKHARAQIKAELQSVLESLSDMVEKL